MARIVITPAAERQLRKLPRELQVRTADVLRRLSADDDTLDRKRLRDRPEIRVRSGDLRVFYVRDGAIVRITRIADRGDAYRR